MSCCSVWLEEVHAYIGLVHYRMMANIHYTNERMIRMKQIEDIGIVEKAAGKTDCEKMGRQIVRRWNDLGQKGP